MHKSKIAFRPLEQMTNKVSKLRFIPSAQIAAILLLAAGLLVSSCGDFEKPKPLTKPFIIVNKFVNYQQFEVAKYFYQDVNGTEYYFTDNNNKYNIGDTLK